MEIKEKAKYISLVLKDKELVGSLIKIYESEGEEVFNTIFNYVRELEAPYGSSYSSDTAKDLIDSILVNLESKVSHPEYWDLTLDDVRNNTPLAQKYPNIDEDEWHEINKKPKPFRVDGEVFNEPYLLEDWNFNTNKPKYSADKLRENYENYIENLK